MTRVAYSCPFVPAEWIAAHGLRPSRIVPGGERATRRAGSPEGVCPYAWAFAREACASDGADAVVVTTVCDQMRRTYEWIARDGEAPAFLMNVPTTWKTPSARTMYADELGRLGRFLVRLGGKAPSREKLACVMRDYDAERTAIRNARTRLGSRAFSEAIAAFHKDGTAAPTLSGRADTQRGVPLAVVGGPLLAIHRDLFDVVEQSGGIVALDATTTGERTLAAPFDLGALERDPFDGLVDAYFGAIPDAFRRPNSALYEWLGEKIGERGIRGIVFHYYAWCDTWHGEAARMKEWAQVPLLAVSSNAEEGIAGHAASRIEAFLEMLR